MGSSKQDEPTSEGVLQCPSCGLSPFGAAIGGQYPSCGTALDGEDRTEQKSEALRSDGNEAVRRRAKSFVSRVCLSASIRDRSRMSSISASSAFQRRVRLETTDRLCRGWRSSATFGRADRRQVDASTTEIVYQ